MWQLNSIYPARAAKHGNLQLVHSPRGALSAWAMQHGSAAKRLFWPLLQLPALRQVDCFHATSQAEYADIRRLGFRQPVAVIPNGIDVPPLPEGGRGNERTLLFLGRMHPVKGLDTLLLAWKAVQDRFPSWRLVIVGDDDSYNGTSGYLAATRELAARLDLERISFPGSLFGVYKQQAYRDADLYVLPTRSENFGMTVAEALAMGTPAIVSRGAPWSGLAERGAGWWIDIGLEPLIECLTEALSRSPDELAIMGDRGRTWMQEAFAWRAVAAKMSDTYAWLCDKSREVPSCVYLD